MRLVNPGKIVELQNQTDGIRNICIMAHVDHGKTTLADSLLASNGIISQRLAGKLRFMDSRKDEQERGITMKSSAISLYHLSESNKKEYLINLIDSPGHVDFSSEVSTAIRLCDGALVLVDVVEGVCAQTIVALRQAWQENIKPVLVLNKIDRLILELKLTPLDAYLHLTQVLEKINAVTAELFTAEVLGKESQKPNSLADDGIQELYDWNSGLEEADDSNLYFAPDQGNIVFTSASDGWGFRLEDFASIYSTKVGFSKAVLKKTLWGDFYLNSKLKRIMKGAQSKAKKPLFVQLILENVWAVYDAVAVRKDKVALEKMIANLGLEIPPRDLRQTDFKAILQVVMSNWLPLSRAVLEMVCSQLPSPLELTETKVERLMLTQSRSFSAFSPKTQNLKADFLKCSGDTEAPTIIFVSKMFAVETKSLPEKRPKALTVDEIASRREAVKQRINERKNQPASSGDIKAHNEDKSVKEPESVVFQRWLSANAESDVSKPENEVSFIAFARVYSGTVRKGQRLFILGPKHDPTIAMEKFPNDDGIDIGITLKDLKKGQFVTAVEISSLYLLMGRELELLDEVPPGCICGIGGLDEHILKTATISSTLACPPFTDLSFLMEPILRVAVEPKHTADMAALRTGLKLLNQADPCVQILVQETGEHVIVTAGEVHLQRCLDDLKERFAKVEITASPPIVPFRETIVDPPKLDMVNEVIQTQQQHSQSGKFHQKNLDSDKKSTDPGLIIQQTANKKSTIKIRAIPLPQPVVDAIDEFASLLKLMKKENEVIDSEKVSEFRKKLSEGFVSSGWKGETVDRIWSFGPHHIGPNILLNDVKNNPCASFWTQTTQSNENLFAYGSNFVNGFQIATAAGPLCEEPLRGIAFNVEEWTCEEGGMDQTSNQPFGPFSGQIMSAVKEACKKAFQAQPQRLMVAMYSSNIQVNSEVLDSEDDQIKLRRGFKLLFSYGLGQEEIVELRSILMDPKLNNLPRKTEYSEGKTLLHAAVIAQDVGSVRILLANGSYVNATDCNGNRPINLTTKYRIIKKLVSKGAFLNAAGRDGYTPLHTAVAFENFKLVKFLITKGAKTDIPVNGPIGFGPTPAELANTIGNKKIISLFQNTTLPRQAIPEEEEYSN